MTIDIEPVLTNQPKKKNNHFVPRSYLQRFRSSSDRQIALYNIKSGRIVSGAPMKSQCSRSYFYTKNPIYEEEFEKIEIQQKSLIDNIIVSRSLPGFDTAPRSLLSTGIMFQAGRTATTVVRTDHIANQFGKAILRHHLERKGEKELLEHLPKVQLKTIDGVMDAISQHLTMYPLIDDLDCTLFINETAEDFLTSDHPIALCNSMPGTRPDGRALGFACRGLIIIYPISPRALLFLSDAEVYKVEGAGGATSLYHKRDVVELNMMQFCNAFENVYFSETSRVAQTLEAFRRRSDSVRPPPPVLSETVLISSDAHRRVLFSMPPVQRRLQLPRAVEVRRAAKTGKYRLGDDVVRDHYRVLAVREELDRVHKLRLEAAERAKREGGQAGV